MQLGLPTPEQPFFNSGYLKGLTSQTPWSQDKYFQAYVASYNQGEYSFFQREYDSSQLNPVNKHYFSGGVRVNVGNGNFLNPEIIPSDSYNQETRTGSSTLVASAAGVFGEMLVDTALSSGSPVNFKIRSINFLGPEEVQIKKKKVPLDQVDIPAIRNQIPLELYIQDKERELIWKIKHTLLTSSRTMFTYGHPTFERQFIFDYNSKAGKLHVIMKELRDTAKYPLDPTIKHIDKGELKITVTTLTSSGSPIKIEEEAVIYQDPEPETDLFEYLLQLSKELEGRHGKQGIVALNLEPGFVREASSQLLHSVRRAFPVKDWQSLLLTNLNLLYASKGVADQYLEGRFSRRNLAQNVVRILELHHIGIIEAGSEFAYSSDFEPEQMIKVLLSGVEIELLVPAAGSPVTKGKAWAGLNELAEEFPDGSARKYVDLINKEPGADSGSPVTPVGGVDLRKIRFRVVFNEH